MKRIVLMVSPLPPPAGGIATWTKRLVQTGLPNNYSIKVVNTYKPGNQVLGELRRTFRILSDLYVTLRKEKVDIVHINSAVSGAGIAREAICAFISHLYKKPIVLHCRCDVSEHIHSTRIIWKPFAQWLFKKADYIINLNTASQMFIKEAYQRDSEYVPNLLDNSFFEGMKQIRNVSNEVNDVLFVGMLVQWKGAQIVLKAASLLPEIRFHVAGRDVDVLKDFKKLPPNVILYGELEYAKVKQLMVQSDLFLFPSYSEGFPNAVMEAMAVGLPIIATNAGAIPDMIGSQGGIIVEKGNVEQLVAAINELKCDAEKRQSMCNFNKEKVRLHYLYDVVTNRYTDIYDKITNY